MKTTTQEAEAIASLKKLLKPGTVVYTLLRHVSASGMSRVLDVYIVRDNEPRRLTYSVAEALGWTYDRKHEGVKIGGCGMDMGFHLVYSLSRRLFPDGFKLPKGTHGRNGDTSGFDRDGGYALNQRWL